MEEVFDRRRETRVRLIESSGREFEGKKRFDPWEPEAVCISEERAGGKARYNAIGDGPKFICGVDFIVSYYNAPTDTSPSSPAPTPCLVYSVGSNNDVKFEQYIKRDLGCEVHTFDPTLLNPFVGDAYATFHPWGFGADGENVTLSRRGNNFNFMSYSVLGAATELNHLERTIDILKIDCEGCEYVAVTEAFEAIAAGRLKIDQVQVELHSRQYAAPRRLFEAADQAKMRIFHKERNNWGCDGYRCVEYAFVSESFLQRANAHTMFCPLPQ